MSARVRLPLISAHRGECGVQHLSAAERYRSAIALGVDFVEFDIRKTADAVLVCYHDEYTPTGNRISASTYSDLHEELRSELLRLDDLLELTGDGVGLHIDLKEQGDEVLMVDRVIERLPAAHMVVTSLEDGSVRKIKAFRPDISVGLSLGRDLEGVNWIRKLLVRLTELFPGHRLRSCGADFVAVHKQLAEVRVLRWCSRHRFPAWVWTLDTESELRRFLWDRRVTAVVTNRPDLARRLLSEQPSAAEGTRPTT